MSMDDVKFVKILNGTELSFEFRELATLFVKLKKYCCQDFLVGDHYASEFNKLGYLVEMHPELILTLSVEIKVPMFGPPEGFVSLEAGEITIFTIELQHFSVWCTGLLLETFVFHADCVNWLHNSVSTPMELYLNFQGFEK